MADSPLHKVPLGLLELMRLKTLGRSPEWFDDVVAGNVDVLESYAAPEQRTNQGTANAGAINTAAGLTSISTVATFRWIWSLGGSLTVGAAPGTFITWSVGVGYGPGATAAALGCGDLRTTVAGQQLSFGITLPRVLILPPGSFWFATVYGDAVGVDHSLNTNLLSVAGALIV